MSDNQLNIFLVTFVTTIFYLYCKLYYIYIVVLYIGYNDSNVICFLFYSKYKGKNEVTEVTSSPQRLSAENLVTL